MRNDATPQEDDLRPEYDASELKEGVRGKYLDRFLAAETSRCWPPTCVRPFRRMSRSTLLSGHCCTAGPQPENVT